ncbi:MAG: dTDP-glucose 4,6-dehydratase [Candidatus Omnitrophota bacterium]|jgi:dTDP-glucose 4,6-dehydratase
MKHLLVTGGCGFIGSNFIRRFLKTHGDWKIFNLDKLSYSGNRENTRALESDERYEFILGDVCDASAVQQAMKNADAVIHFAAETHVDRSIECASEFLHTNVLGTQVMLDAAIRCRIRRYIHISTDEVYGSIAQGAAKEDAVLKPNSPYSASKAAADLLVRAYRKTHGFPGMIVRSSNNFGPYQFPEKVIPLFITNLIEGKKVPLYGSGLNERDWIFVEDNCRAIETVFERGEEGKTYNIGVGRPTSNLTLTRTILQLMKKDESMIQPVEDRRGHDFRYSIDTSSLESLGFRPEWEFEKGLKHTIQWYEKHPDWWSPLKKDKFTVK